MNYKSLPVVALLALAVAALPACKESQTKPDEAEAVEAQPATGQSAGADDQSGERPDDGSDDLRDKVMTLLSGYEHMPTKKEFEDIGSPGEVTDLLIELYRDDSVPKYQRVKALGALRFFPEQDRARKHFEGVLTDEATSDTARRVAVKAYGFAYDGQAVELLATLLDHDDYHTRDAAVRTLIDIDTPDARTALQKRADQESEKAIKQRIADYLDGNKPSVK